MPEYLATCVPAKVWKSFTAIWLRQAQTFDIRCWILQHQSNYISALFDGKRTLLALLLTFEDDLIFGDFYNHRFLKPVLYTMTSRSYASNMFFAELWKICQHRLNFHLYFWWVIFEDAVDNFIHRRILKVIFARDDWSKYSKRTLNVVFCSTFWIRRLNFNSFRSRRRN